MSIIVSVEHSITEQPQDTFTLAVITSRNIQYKALIWNNYALTTNFFQTSKHLSDLITSISSLIITQDGPDR